MNFSSKKVMRAYFSRKLFWAIFWFALVCAIIYAQIELFYGPWQPFCHNYTYLFGMVCCCDLVSFCISLGNLLTRLVTRFNYTGRLRRDLRYYVSERETADPYTLLDEDICFQPGRPAPIFLGNKWLITPAHAMLRERLVGVFFEELRKSFLSNKVRLTVVDDMGNSFYLDVAPGLHPALFNELSQLHPCATNADHRVLRGFWQQENVDYRRLRLNNEPPRKVSANL